MSKRCQEICYFSDIQALTQAKPYECIVPEGLDGRNKRGSLYRNKENASGRVDVQVGVARQSLALVTPTSRVEKNVFAIGVEGNTKVHRVTGSTEMWEMERRTFGPLSMGSVWDCMSL